MRIWIENAKGCREHDAGHHGRSDEERAEHDGHHAEEGRVARPGEQACRHEAGPLPVETDAPGGPHPHLGGEDNPAAEGQDSQTEPGHARMNERGDRAGRRVNTAKVAPTTTRIATGNQGDGITPVPRPRAGAWRWP